MQEAELKAIDQRVNELLRSRDALTFELDAEAKRAAGQAPAAASAAGSKWNAGNYHWEEKSLKAFAKERLTELLLGVSVAAGTGECRVTKAAVEGDAFMNIRKGKKALSYELSVKADWSGEMKDGDGRSLVRCVTLAQRRCPPTGDHALSRAPLLACKLSRLARRRP
jgi:hypothetical protein